MRITADNCIIPRRLPPRYTAVQLHKHSTTTELSLMGRSPLCVSASLFLSGRSLLPRCSSPWKKFSASKVIIIMALQAFPGEDKTSMLYKVRGTVAINA